MVVRVRHCAVPAVSMDHTVLGMYLMFDGVEARMNRRTFSCAVHTVDVDYISSHCSLPSDTYLAVVFTTRVPPNTTRLAANTITSLSTDTCTCNVPPTCRYM